MQNNGLSEGQNHVTTVNVKNMFIKNQPKLLILEFNDDRSHIFREMRRDELLKEARSAIPVETQSNEQQEKKPPRKGKFIGTLRSRDIRSIDTSFSNANDPSIIVRKHSVLVNLPPIKALIVYNKCYLVVPDGADSMLQPLKEKLKSHSTHETHGFESFELKAIEAIFRTVSVKLEDELNRLHPEVKEMLEKLSAGRAHLESFRHRIFCLFFYVLVQQVHSELTTKIRQIQHAFTEILDNDRDMALMYLSKVRTNPSLYTEDKEETWSNDHEEVELLIENYLQAVDGCLNSSVALGNEIEAAISLLKVRLDSARNHLLRLDIYVSAVTSAAGIGAFLAGIFGMNLTSGLESNQNGMLFVGLALFGFSSLFVVFLVSYMKIRGWLVDGLAH